VSDVTESAIPGALTAQYHKCGCLFTEALHPVGAVCFLTYSI